MWMGKGRDKMKKMYYCFICKTKLTYEIVDPKEFSYKFNIDITTAPLCPCKMGHMVDMQSPEYAYGTK